MNRRPAPLIALLAVVLLTTSCGGDPPPPTQIVQFQANATTMNRGDTVTLTWEIANPGRLDTAFSCSITRYAENEPIPGPFEVPCTGSRNEVPPAPTTARWITYQLNALKQPLNTSDPYLSIPIRIQLIDPEHVAEVVTAQDPFLSDPVANVELQAGEAKKVKVNIPTHLRGDGQRIVIETGLESDSLDMVLFINDDDTPNASTSGPAYFRAGKSGLRAGFYASELTTQAKGGAARDRNDGISASAENRLSLIPTRVSLHEFTACRQPHDSVASRGNDHRHRAGEPMRRLTTRHITTLALGLTVALALTACPNPNNTEPDQTRIVSFEANATDIGRNTPITLTWQVDNPGTSPSEASCSMSLRPEHGTTDRFPVECTGNLIQIPPAPSTATYIRYQLNALDRSGGYLTQVITIDVADPGDLLWVRQIDSTADDYVSAVAVDRHGSAVLGGRTLGDLEGTNAGNTDVFVRRYAPNGTEEWTRQFGALGWDRASGIAVDTDGDIVLIGNLNSCAFTRKFTAAGAEVWTRQPCLDDHAVAVATDKANNVFTVVSTYDPISGYDMVHLRSYTPTGGDRWTVDMNSGYEEWIRAIATDPDGNFIVAGTDDLGLGAFVRKFDANGQVLWSDFFAGGSDYSSARGVAVDGVGSVVVVGNFVVAEDGYHDDIFVRKLSPAGDVLWTREFGSTNDDFAGGVAVDETGHIIVVGSTTGNLAQPPVGQREVFVRKYDPDGEEVWTRQFAISLSDWPRDVAVDASGVIFVAGDTYGADSNNGFLAKLAK